MVGLRVGGRRALNSVTFSRKAGDRRGRHMKCVCRGKYCFFMNFMWEISRLQIRNKWGRDWNQRRLRDLFTFPTLQDSDTKGCYGPCRIISILKKLVISLRTVVQSSVAYSPQSLRSSGRAYGLAHTAFISFSGSDPYWPGSWDEETDVADWKEFQTDRSKTNPEAIVRSEILSSRPDRSRLSGSVTRLGIGVVPHLLRFIEKTH